MERIGPKLIEGAVFAEPHCALGRPRLRFRYPEIFQRRKIDIPLRRRDRVIAPASAEPARHRIGKRRWNKVKIRRWIRRHLGHPGHTIQPVAVRHNRLPRRIPGARGNRTAILRTGNGAELPPAPKIGSSRPAPIAEPPALAERQRINLKPAVGTALNGPGS